MKTLHITLKKRWFDLIASGEKKEEYRELKPYWINRFFDKDLFLGIPIEDLHKEVMGFHPVEVMAYQHRFNIVSANNGYSKNCPNIKWQHKGIRIGKPKPAWCEPEDVGKTLFILDIGDIITT